MSTQTSFSVIGESPFDQDGIFEVELAISEAEPTSSEIQNKSFSSIWKEKLHLKVKNGKFQEKIGSAENPLPDAISSFSKVWKIVNFFIIIFMTVLSSYVFIEIIDLI